MQTSLSLFALGAIVCSIIVWAFLPDWFLAFPKQHPEFWLCSSGLWELDSRDCIRNRRAILWLSLHANSLHGGGCGRTHFVGSAGIYGWLWRVLCSAFVIVALVTYFAPHQ